MESFFFETEIFKTFQAKLNAVELKEFSSPVNSCSSKGFREEKTFREFLNPIHNDVNVAMGRNQRVAHDANALRNPIPVVAKSVTVDEHPVTQKAGPVLVKTVKIRKMRVGRFYSDVKKGKIKLCHTRADLTAIAEA